MPSTRLEYRLRIRNQANDGNLLVLSSRKADANCLLTEEPSGDGQRIDWAEGTSEVGVQVWRAWDRDDGADARTITAQLADANARNQMLSNLCVGEYSRNGGAWTAFHTGYLNSIRLIDAGTFELTVGDTDRREQDGELFKTLTTAFNRGSCILGGPIQAIDPVAYGETPAYAFAGINDYGPVRMQKVANISGLGFCITLTLVSGYVRPYYKSRLTSVGADEVETINRLAAQWFQWNPIPYVTGGVQPFGDFPGLTLRLRRVSDGNVVESIPVAIPVGLAARFTGGTPDGSHEFMVKGSTMRLIVKWPAPLAVPANGTQYDVTVFPHEVSENAPLHVAGNPVDLATAAMTQERITYNAASAATVRAALARIWLEYRYTGSVKLKDFLEKQLYGPWGFGARLNAAGEKEFYQARAAAPSSVDTVTLSDVVSDE